MSRVNRNDGRPAALICGSFAYDHIMVFPDRFANHILPEKTHMLNVSFLVPEMRREFGGCAGNIAHMLNLLSPGSALPMATVGRDFAPYADWLLQNQIDASYVLALEEHYTAQAFITTDLDDNQITAFHPGAMNYAHRNQVSDCPQATIGILSPDGRDGMLEHARQFAEAGIPFIFDPGQGTPMFSGEELRTFISQADWISANDYEWQLITHRTGLSIEQAAEQVQAVIITHGGKGSVIHTRDAHYQVPPADTSKLLDPTGCGDAYRAGLLHGLMRGMEWPEIGRLASLLGAIQMEHNGTQNYRVHAKKLATRFEQNYGYRLSL